MTVQENHGATREKMPPQPVVSGCYFLFLDRALVYVGKSRDVYGRINAHRVNGRKFDYALVSACPEHDMAWVEAALIKAFDPADNSTHKVKKKPGGPPSEFRQLQLRPLPQLPGTDELPGDPNMVVPKRKALAYAKCFAKAPALAAAIADGSVAHSRPGGVGPIYIRVGDIKTFCGASDA